MSETTNHTPGPWHCNPEPDLPRIGVYAGTGDDVIICDVTDEDLSSLPSGRMAVDGELAANARLIAAAPDLLERCMHLRKILRVQPKPELGGWNWPQMADDLDAAIAKATGHPTEAPK